MKRILLYIAATLLVGQPGSGFGDTKPARIALVGATIIDGTGMKPIPKGVVLIEGNKIMAVARSDEIVLPRGVRRIDASEKTIIPGLMDANVHLVMRRGRADAIHRYEDLIVEAAQVALKFGQTSVFDTWGVVQPLMNIRDRINRGEAIGSRIFLAGNCIGMPGPIPLDSKAAVPREVAERINRLNAENVGEDLRFMTAGQVRMEVRKYIASGVDFLKYAASGHSHPDMIVFSDAVQRAIVDEGHKAGLTVQAHTTSNESLRMAIKAGVDIITHADVTGPVPIPGSILDVLKDRRIPCGFFPKTNRRWRIEIEGGSQTPGAKIRKTLETQRSNQSAMKKAGISLLLNTDGGLWPPDIVARYQVEHWTDYEAIIGEGYFIRCRGMADMGISPMDIILAGTRNVAAAYNKLDILGTLEAGKLADLVVLDANPLDNIDNLRRIWLVMKEGRVVERDRLPEKAILFPHQPKLFETH